MLVIRDLVKVYPGPVSALQGIHLEIPNGMFGLLGPNGAGKSTLMKIISGLLEPTSGSVLLDGEDITAEPAKVWDKLGYLPQDFGFYPHLSGRAMLAHLLKLQGVKAPGGMRKLCDELLERVHLSDAAKRKCKEYSGGMRQRLGIAQAIAGDPRILIVDEPTAGLDPEERLRFYRILGELAQDRIVLLSTHIVEDVAVLCPHFAVIRGGELVAQSTPRAARGAIDGKIYEGSADADRLESLQDEYTVIQVMLRDGQNLVRIYQPSGVAPAGFQTAEATLEDAYLTLMRVGQDILPKVDATQAAAAPAPEPIAAGAARGPLTGSDGANAAEDRL